MKMSQLFTKTSKNVPADEQSKNARLLIQAGYINKEMAGVYNYLPLGLIVFRNIEGIIREEMNAIGGQEVFLSALQPKEKWEKSGRWDDNVLDIWFKTRMHAGDGFHKGPELGLGNTHEEPLTAIMRNFVTSYKDLPAYPYQFQTKFRNELRSKSGIMRTREFIMKDMYSFSRDQAQHDEFYEKAKQAYIRIFERVGLGDITHVTLASGGSFSRYSHEFQTITDVGEDWVFQTKDGTYYNREIAPSKMAQPNPHEDAKEYQEMQGEGVIGVEALLEHLHITIQQSTKTLIYTTDTGETVVAALRSDYDINDIKLCEALGCKSVRFADEEAVKKLTGADIGYAGLVNLPKDVRVIMDDSLEGLCNFETGSNKSGYHSVNTNFERDVSLPERFYDVKVAKKGDLDPASSEEMSVQRATEVGNIFTLGTKFSDALNLTFTDEAGKVSAVIMGCYGIGPARLMGTIVEHFSDDRGIIWPREIAPFIVYLAPLGENEAVLAAADELYNRLTAANISVIYDNRTDARPGEKFADADLLGIPFRVVVSEKTIATQQFEIKKRAQQEVTLLDLEGVLKMVA